MKKKKKTGSVAIPFLITFLVSLVIIGGAAMFIYDKVDNDESSLLSMANEVGTLSSDDDHTILLVLDMSDSIVSSSDDYDLYQEDYSDGEEDEEEYDEEEDEDNEDEDYYDDYSPASHYVHQPYTFMLLRSRPVDKKMTFIGIPSDMLIGEANRQAQDIYLDNGVVALRNSIQYTLDVNIDRYMQFDTESFKKLCNILGGVNYPVPKGVEGIEYSGEEQYLSAEQTEAIISCGSLSGGELQRISTACSLAAAMMNQTSGERIAGNLDNSFNAMVNVAKTDISAIDYNNRKYAIKFMLKYSDPTDDNETRSSRADFVTPYGSMERSGFAADKYFSKDIKMYFESDKDKKQDPEDNTQEDTNSEKENSDDK